MSHKLRIYFTGLCLFDLRDPDEDGKPELCKVFLINATKEYPGDEQGLTHRHVPLMTVDPRNLSDGSDARLPDALSTGPDGRDYVVFRLEENYLKMIADGGLEVPMGRRKASPPLESPVECPNNKPGCGHWFDWALSVPAIATEEGEGTRSDIGKLKAACETPDKGGPVITTLELSHGRVLTHEIPQMNGAFAVHRFESLNGRRSAERRHAFADRVVVELEFEEAHTPVIFDASGASGPGKIRIKPFQKARDEIVEVAVTNLPAKFNPYCPKDRVYDFLWFYTAFEWKSGPKELDELMIPTPVGSVTPNRTPSTGDCPPAWGG